MVVEDVRQVGDAVAAFAGPLACGFKFVPQEVADGLGAVLVAAGFDQGVEFAGQFVVERDGDSFHV